MIIKCTSCSRKFVVKDIDIPKEGRMVRCGYCSVTWHQMPSLQVLKLPKKSSVSDSSEEYNEGPSIDEMKASDGKTYKFLGSQWAQLLPSGKTGLFAKKKIGKELDNLTGRKKEIPIKKKNKRIKDVDPSAQKGLSKQLPDIYKPREGIGFFGVVFLFIIISFSLVGVLKTFENDLINYLPQAEYFYEFLDEQLNYFAETVKNIIIIIKDLVDSY
jgi:predicted Zn finger-like uncharacterized protein